MQEYPTSSVVWSGEIVILGSEDRNTSADFVALDEEGNRNWEGLFRQLSGFVALSDDWDGLGAEAPKEELVQTALDLLSIIRDESAQPPTRFLPTSTGGFLFEWQALGHYLEAEISIPGEVEWMSCRENEEPDFETQVFYVAPPSGFSPEYRNAVSELSTSSSIERRRAA